MLKVEILIEAAPWHDVNQLDQLVALAANTAMDLACKEQNGFLHDAYEVAINLSDDRHIQSLNQRFRDKDKPTNVLSFPFEDDFPEHAEGLPSLGDLILSHETISVEAHEQNKPLHHHISHLVVHGILHLLGYDHMNEPDAQKMEGLEIKILEKLQIPSPYRET